MSHLDSLKTELRHLEPIVDVEGCCIRMLDKVIVELLSLMAVYLHHHACPHT